MSVQTVRGRGGRGGDMKRKEVREVSYEYCMTKATKPDDDADYEDTGQEEETETV
jgi:hypothetical protein